MKRFLVYLLAMTAIMGLRAQSFDEFFEDKTLRIDYSFGGNAQQQTIGLDELASLPTWAGRRHNLDRLPLAGNGQITVRDVATGKVIYRTSFSSLFQEWLTTDEAQSVSKHFENTFLVPYPKQKVEVEVSLLNNRRQEVARLKHVVDPADILIHTKGVDRIQPHRYLHQGGSYADCIDVAILAEGYTAQEMEGFYKDAQRACEALFAHEPFGSMKHKFNIVAVGAPSADSGVSVPRRGEWKETVVHSHFDTFYSARYLTTSHVKDLHNALAGIPYEHIIILANTNVYGGGGIYNSYTLTTTHHPQFAPVVVHEFGHSFGGLGDEYYYDNDLMTDTYPLDVEPWEPNITTLVDFASKWEALLPTDCPRPTPTAQAKQFPVGLYEGGGYSAKGIYRPADNCRMRTNDHPGFCLACQEALKKLILFYVP